MVTNKIMLNMILNQIRKMNRKLIIHGKLIGKEYLKVNPASRDNIKSAWSQYMTETNFLNVLSDIIESTFDIKIVLVNNAVVDTMEEIMEDGHRLEIDDRNYNTLMFLRMDFSSGYEPSLPNVSLVHDDSGNDILYKNLVLIFI